MTGQDWRARAACRTSARPDDWLVSDLRKPGNRMAAARALTVCQRCPVAAACYRYYASLDRSMRRDVVAGGAVWSPTGRPDRKLVAS